MGGNRYEMGGDRYKMGGYRYPMYGDRRSSYRDLLEKHEEKRNSEDLEVDGRVIKIHVQEKE
jgi:hypothetical protein